MSCWELYVGELWQNQPTDTFRQCNPAQVHEEHCRPETCLALLISNNSRFLKRHKMEYAACNAINSDALIEVLFVRELLNHTVCHSSTVIDIQNMHETVAWSTLQVRIGLRWWLKILRTSQFEDFANWMTKWPRFADVFLEFSDIVLRNGSRKRCSNSGNFSAMRLTPFHAAFWSALMLK